MRITSKGQLTIPKAIRESAGLMPGADVQVVCEDGVVVVRKLASHEVDAADRRVAQFRGRGNRRFTTDELMALLRGD